MFINFLNFIPDDIVYYNKNNEPILKKVFRVRLEGMINKEYKIMKLNKDTNNDEYIANNIIKELVNNIKFCYLDSKNKDKVFYIDFEGEDDKSLTYFIFGMIKDSKNGECKYKLSKNHDKYYLIFDPKYYLNNFLIEPSIKNKDNTLYSLINQYNNYETLNKISVIKNKKVKFYNKGLGRLFINIEVTAKKDYEDKFIDKIREFGQLDYNPIDRFAFHELFKEWFCCKNKKYKNAFEVFLVVKFKAINFKVYPSVYHTLYERRINFVNPEWDEMENNLYDYIMEINSKYYDIISEMLRYEKEFTLLKSNRIVEK